MARKGRSPVSIGLLFDWHAEQDKQTVVHLDRPFDIAPEAGLVLDGAALARTVREASGWLGAAGLGHGDNLVVCKDNHFDSVLLAAAAARIGALPVLMSPLVPPAFLRTMIGRAAPAVLVISPSVLYRAAAAGIELAPPGTRIVVLDGPDGLEGPGGLGVEGPEGLGVEAAPGVVRLADVRGAAEVPARIRPPEEPMFVTHTSGTTGVPKLVVHAGSTSLATFAFRLESRRLPMMTSTRDDVVAGCFSFVHNRLFSWINSQCSLAPRKTVIMSDPELDAVARVLQRHRPTSIEALPNMFQYWEELADRRPELFAQVKRFCSTFDAVHPRTVRTFLEVSRSRFPVWATGLGQSEIAGISINVFTRGMARRWARKSSGHTTNVGWPPLVRIKIVDQETGRTMPRNQPGLIMVAAKARCLTYLGEDDRHRAKTVDGWWNSGDYGMRDRLGRVRMLDREVDSVLGISCIELESTLLERLPRASEVTVLTVADGLPVPVLSMRADTLDPEEWRRASADLPPMDEPRLVPWKQVPRTATWKVRRVELREQVLGVNRVPGTGKWT